MELLDAALPRRTITREGWWGRMEMHVACYYTLSTISQTLAGAFGFLLAVVLYRIQAIGNGLPGKTGAFEVEEIPPSPASGLRSSS
jgi:hypothetical protein